MGLSTTNVELGMEQATIEGVMSRHRQDPSASIAILQDLQEEVNYLPEGALRYVAERLDIPASKVYSLATFYRAFSLEPRGRHLIHVCTGTACHVRGAGRILDALERETGLMPAKPTRRWNSPLKPSTAWGPAPWDRSWS